MTKDYVKAYSVHGALLSPYSDKDSVGNCRFCGSDDHFMVNMSNGQFRCLHCEERGNLYTFLRHIWNEARTRTEPRQYRDLSCERGISADTLSRFVAYDSHTHHWMLAVESHVFSGEDGGGRGSWKLTNIRSWVDLDGKGKLLGTPTCKSHVFNAEALTTKPRRVYFCEGEWDAMALIDCDPPDDVAILGVPGAGYSLAAWISTFPFPLTDTEAVLLYDHDRPGTQGSLRFLQKKPQARILLWDDEKPKGYDIRDLVNSGIPSSEVWEYIHKHLV